MEKYVKVMFGINSGAGDFQYEIGRLNVAIIWNPKAKSGKDSVDLIFQLKK